MNNSSLESDNATVVLGQIGRAHGIKGWLKLNSFTSPAENILDYPQLQVDIGSKCQLLEIDEFKSSTKGLLVHFKGYDDPETARVLVGLELSVGGRELPGLEQGDYYWHQLEGLKVINQNGLLFGLVSKILETGANDVLVVTASQDSIDERERLIPYLKDSVIERIDLEKGTIKVNWEADYLD